MVSDVGAGNPKSGPLQEQQVHLTVEPSFQLPLKSFKD